MAANLVQHAQNVEARLGQVHNELTFGSMVGTLPRFSGDPKDFTGWMKAVEKAKLLLGGDATMGMRLALASTEGAASDYVFRYFNANRQNLVWNNFTQQLQARFGQPADEAAALAKLRRAKRKDGEPFQMYAERLHILAEEAWGLQHMNHALAQRTLIETFLAGVRNEKIARYLIRNPQPTLERAVNAAAEEMSVVARIDGYRTDYRDQEEPMEVNVIDGTRSRALDPRGNPDLGLANIRGSRAPSSDGSHSIQVAGPGAPPPDNSPPPVPPLVPTSKQLEPLSRNEADIDELIEEWEEWVPYESNEDGHPELEVLEVTRGIRTSRPAVSGSSPARRVITGRGPRPVRFKQTYPHHSYNQPPPTWSYPPLSYSQQIPVYQPPPAAQPWGTYMPPTVPVQLQTPFTSYLQAQQVTFPPGPTPTYLPPQTYPPPPPPPNYRQVAHTSTQAHHPHTNNTSMSDNTSQQRPPLQWAEDGKPYCAGCGELGHIRRDCPNAQKSTN